MHEIRVVQLEGSTYQQQCTVLYYTLYNTKFDPFLLLPWLLRVWLMLMPVSCSMS